MTHAREALSQALAKVRARIGEAEQARDQDLNACGHSPALGRNVTLLAVSKRQPLQVIAALYDLGVRDFGENYVQEMIDKARRLAATGRRPRWHLIGHLQRNKVAATAAVGALVHTVDSLKLAQKLASHQSAEGNAQPAPIFMQVRLTDDVQRPGAAPSEAAALAQAIFSIKPLRLVGLMGVPPKQGSVRAHYARLAALQRNIAALPKGHHVQHLSMGTSDDFREAILEGATMVRVGSALFGPRTQDPGDSP